MVLLLTNPFYVATYFPDFQELVETMMSHLPVFLEAKFGKKVWECFSIPFKIQMSDFFFDAETNTVVAGNKDTDKLEWEDRNDKFYAEHFGVACTFDNIEHENKKLMQFNLSN